MFNIIENNKIENFISQVIFVYQNQNWKFFFVTALRFRRDPGACEKFVFFPQN